MEIRKTIPFILSLFVVMAVLIGCRKEEENKIEIGYGKMTDQDGNSYKTILIGTQTWMAENLRTLHYRNGDLIPVVTNNTDWRNQTAGAYCGYGNSSDSNHVKTYGLLYNWFAVSDPRSIAPEGWHVPTNDDWRELITFLGGEDEMAEKIKESGESHWKNNPDATNVSGFTALPAGYRDGYSGLFKEFGGYGTFWSATQFQACFIYRFEDNDYLIHQFLFGINDLYGLSVRLVKNK